MAPNAPTATRTPETSDAGQSGQTHVTEHVATVTAPPRAVYDLIADAAGWPQVFGPTVHSEIVEERGGEQLLRLWATANGQVRTWTSRRVLDPQGLRVSFRQTVSAAPVAAMGGEWIISPHEDGSSRVTLLHDFRAVDDDPESVRLIEQAVDHNSREELTALRNAAELGAHRSELVFTFSDEVRVNGAAEDVYAFLNRAELWPERLPHVAALRLTEPEPGIQQMDMDTRAPDGSLHNSVSIRVCQEDRRTIWYKQLRVPVALSGHTGRWVIEPDPAEPGALTVTSWHTVTLDPQGVSQLLGPNADLAEARDLVRKALGGNSSITLRHAREFAEGRRP